VFGRNKFGILKSKYNRYYLGKRSCPIKLVWIKWLGRKIQYIFIDKFASWRNKCIGIKSHNRQKDATVIFRSGKLIKIK
jgi:hypothetical protein